MLKRVFKTTTKVKEEWFPTHDEYQPLVEHVPYTFVDIIEVEEVPQDIFYVNIFGEIKDFVQYEVIPEPKFSGLTEEDIPF